MSTGPASSGRIWGRVGYALFFCVGLPLVLWAVARTMPVSLPAPHSPGGGILLIAAGLTLMLAGMAGLWIHGGGLPMNLSPPPRLVSRGIFALLPHPIYTGFCAACFGASLATGSAAGYWVITPMAVLGVISLVWGYERHDLRRRFPGLEESYRPGLRIPRAATDPKAADPPSAADRWSVVLLVLVPWVLLYEYLSALPLPADAVTTFLPFERNWPVVQVSYPLYASLYIMPVVAVFLARRRYDLREFSLAGLTGTFLGMLCFVVLPLVAPSRPFTPDSMPGHWLAFERGTIPVDILSFPSFHVFWALLSAWLMSRRSRAWRIAGWTWAALVLASCLATGMHSLVDLLAGALLFLFALHRRGIYRGVLRPAALLVDSFHTWRIGPVRVINHGIYAFLAAGTGILLAGTLAGGTALPALMGVAFCSVVGAALWAQLIEGSPRLQRPFGYYGSIFGGIAGALAAPLLGSSPWPVMAALATAAPFIQAIGRVRCLVQGCCHGRPIEDASCGLRVHHPSSRVCKFTGWTGVALHPTQVYSILGNLIIGLLLLRLYLAEAPQTVVLGLYFLLAGMARFVEEAYRGEPQTQWFCRLSEYQWLALVFVAGGLALLALPFAAPCPRPAANLQAAGAALAAGIFTALAMSVDFPASNRRFARLSG